MILQSIDCIIDVVLSCKNTSSIARNFKFIECDEHLSSNKHTCPHSLTKDLLNAIYQSPYIFIGLKCNKQRMNSSKTEQSFGFANCQQVMLVYYIPVTKKQQSQVFFGLFHTSNELIYKA